jgi:serine/threonine-protein kinase PRP4
MNSWREELEKTDRAAEDDDDDDAPPEGVVPVETDEDVEKKLAESRARREALMAKWVNRGEDGGGLQFAETNTSLHDEEGGSDGEVDAFFAKKQAELKDSDKKDDEKVIEEKKAVNRFILLQRAERDGDMFDEDEENNDALKKGVSQADAIGQTGASGDDWNDAEGYYRAKIGEMMDGRYRVTEENCGKGTFSGVVKATDMETKTQVAIKIMRCNDMMKKAAEKEIEILENLRKSDKENKRNVIRLHRTFLYRGHLCLVFECMWDNLRVALKKYTKDKGMSLRAVRAYTRQLIIALQHIHRLQYIHADIKPDNILISAGHNLVKICDLGSAMELTEVEVTPYLVSRFYRAPEIVLGIKYGQSADTFSLGASLCELFTGKILFPGKSNNDMLRLFMELKGKFPHKMIKSGTTWQQHFDENLDFKYVASDPVTRKRKTRVISDLTAKRSVLDTILQRVGTEKQKSTDSEDQLYIKKAKQFADLINQMTALDPEKRAEPTALLKHPFLAENWPAPKTNQKS